VIANAIVILHLLGQSLEGRLARRERPSSILGVQVFDRDKRGRGAIAVFLSLTPGPSPVFIDEDHAGRGWRSLQPCSGRPGRGCSDGPFLRFRCAPGSLSEHIGNRMHLPALHLPYQSLVVILLVGLVAGWIAAKFMTKYGMGIVGDVIAGVIGAYIGNWLAPRLGVHFGTGLVRTILNATGGAIVLLLLVRLIRRV
jgi:uncharacterized membrane protein YeaQ/YmgE (transglycosylase-associated protein family)